MDSTFLMIIGVVLGAVIASVILKVGKSTPESNLEKIMPEIENRFNKLSRDALRTNSEEFSKRFQELAKEKLERTAEKVNSDLEAKKNVITSLVEEIRKDLGKNQEYLKKSDNERISNFSALKKELEMSKQVTSELKSSTDDLKRLLSNNQERGKFGEQVAENLLKMSGFVVGTDYLYNKEQGSVDTRPDFTLFLPDKTKINIDVKFPYSALVKYTECEEKTEKEQHLRQFTTDIKQKIKQVTTRDYINPEDKTVDFVVMFIPNEMIFSFIYEKLNDTWEDAMAKKVIMAGPFSFTAILRMVKQAYSNFRYQENLHHIIKKIQQFDAEFQKYSESIDKLGENISRTSKQFEIVSGTRTRMLTRIVDQIKAEKVPVSSDAILGESKLGKSDQLKLD